MLRKITLSRLYISEDSEYSELLSSDMRDVKYRDLETRMIKISLAPVRF